VVPADLSLIPAALQRGLGPGSERHMPRLGPPTGPIESSTRHRTAWRVTLNDRSVSTTAPSSLASSTPSSRLLGTDVVVA